VPIRDAPWVDTLTRWYAEGLPEDVPLEDYFGFDIDFMSVDASPRFEQKILSEDDEYQVYTDRFGYTVKRARFRGGTMDFMDHVTKDRAVWDSRSFGAADGQSREISTCAGPGTQVQQQLNCK
jgi:hypothetical protein